MTRLLIWAICGTTMLVLMTAGMLRWELAAPGISPLFAAPDGQPNANAYEATRMLHGLLGQCLMLLISAWLGFLAVAQGARAHRIWAWPLSLVTLGLVALVLAVALWPGSEGSVGGWSLYQPLSARPFLARIDPIALQLLLPISKSIAHAGLLLGAFAMVATKPGFRIPAAIGAALCLGLIAVTLLTAGEPSAMAVDLLMLVPLLVLLALLSVRLIDNVPDWAPHLVIGVMGWLGVLFFELGDDPVGMLDGTAAKTALAHLGGYAMACFVLLAGMIFHLRPRLPGWFGWCHALLIWAGLLLVFVPIYGLGQMGMPSAYPDYPDAFAAPNLRSSLLNIPLGLILLGGGAFILRHR